MRPVRRELQVEAELALLGPGRYHGLHLKLLVHVVSERLTEGVPPPRKTSPQVGATIREDP